MGGRRGGSVGWEDAALRFLRSSLPPFFLPDSLPLSLAMQSVEFSSSCNMVFGGYWQLTVDTATPVAVMFSVDKLDGAAAVRVTLSAVLLIMVRHQHSLSNQVAQG